MQLLPQNTTTTQTLDLAYFDNSGTDTQTIAATLSGTILQLLPQNTTTTQTLDLAYFDNSGTDTQSIAELAYEIGTGSLTVGITSGASRTISLATLGNTTVSGTLIVNTAIGIGDSTPTEATLVVSGTIAATGSITAGATLTPDYVFEKFFIGKSELNPAYEFPSLEEVEAFVKENHHLPNIPSAAAVEEQGGIVLNRASELQLEKIEELFLHTIEQEKQIKALEQSNKAYQEKLQRQEDLLLKLAQRLEALEEKE